MNKRTVFTVLCLSLSTFVVSNFAYALEIAEDTTAPVSTSTADEGVAGDISILGTGSITLEEGATLPAITLDSSNSISVEGDIEINNTDSIQAILLQGGNTGELSISGVVQIIEDYERVDADEDGDEDGAYAEGTDRTGVLVSGGSALGADILLNSGGVIYVEGNNSRGIATLSELQGDIRNGATINVLGDDSTAISIQAEMTGNIANTGSITTLGENSVGIDIDAPIGGTFSNSGSITSTGFASATTTNYIDPDLVTEDTLALEDRLDADEILIGGSAVRIRASISEGVLNNGIVDGFIDEVESEDETKDTVEDFDENRSTGSLIVYGSAPAISIAAESNGSVDNLEIGLVTEYVVDNLDDDGDSDFSEILTTFEYDYGLINRGTISSVGLNHGVSATGLLVEGASDGSRSTVIEGGVFNSGSLNTTAYEADATSVAINNYAQAETFWNEGSIYSYSESTNLNSATGLRISEFGQVTSLTNMGSITAEVYGDDASARAVQDLSGTLLDITNRGSIRASLTERDEQNSGVTIALDLSTATDAINILQDWQTPTDDTNADDAVNVEDVTTPSIIGDILLGSGSDSVDIRAGALVTEVFNFGDGVDQLSISTDAAIEASLDEDADIQTFVVAGIYNLETLSVDNASLEIANTDTVSLDSLNIVNGADLTLDIDLDDIDYALARLQVSGSAFIDSSSILTTNFVGFERDAFSLILIEAGDLDLEGQLDISLNIELPAVYTQVIESSDTSLSVSLETKTAEEMGLKESYYSSYDALLGLASELESVGTQLTGYTDTDAFIEAYSQLLPDTSQITAKFLAAQIDLSTSLTGNRLENIGREGTGQWFEYSFSRGAQSEGEQATSYSGRETNIAVGFDGQFSENFYLGASAALRTSNYTIDKIFKHNIRSAAYDFSLYSRLNLGSLSFDSSITGGILDQYSNRNVNFGTDIEEYEGEWSGNYYAASALLSYQKNFGRYFIRPSIGLDYFSISEDDYSETLVSDAGDLALSVAGVDTSVSSSTAKISFGFEDWVTASDFRGGRGYGSSKQFYVGFRGESSDTYSSTASFLGGSGYDFDIYDDIDREDSIIFGLNITLLSLEGNSFTVGYAGEQSGDFVRHGLQSHIRISF